MRDGDLGFRPIHVSHIATPRHQPERDAVAAEQRHELAPRHIGHRLRR